LLVKANHLGNVRSVIAKDVSSSAVEVLSYSDYYPHGGVLPGRNFVASPSYKFGGSVQGQWKDEETNFSNFELRQMDPRLGRWFTPDPMGQFFSPYLAMGNDPVSNIDPTGGESIGGNPDWGDYMDAGFNSASEYAFYMGSYDPLTSDMDRYQNRNDAASNANYYTNKTGTTETTRGESTPYSIWIKNEGVNATDFIGPDPLSVGTGTITPVVINEPIGDDVTGFIQNSTETQKLTDPVRAALNDGAAWLLNNLTPLGVIDDGIVTYGSDDATVHDKIKATLNIIVAGAMTEEGAGRPKLINGIPENPGVVRRFMSKEEFKAIKKDGFKYNPNDSRGGLSSTSKNIAAKNSSKIKKSTGALHADYFVDINVKGKNVGLKGMTKGGVPDWKIRTDINPADIINSGKVLK
jgi:RHS repeat-associated protein